MLRKLLTNSHKTFIVGNPNTCTIRCNHRIPATLYTLEIWFVACIYNFKYRTKRRYKIIIIICKHRPFPSMCRTVNVSNPVRDKTFLFSKTSRWSLPPFLPNHLFNGFQVLSPGVKRPRREVTHWHSSCAEVKEAAHLLPLSVRMVWTAAAPCYHLLTNHGLLRS